MAHTKQLQGWLLPLFQKYLHMSETLLLDKSTKLRNCRSAMPLMFWIWLYAAVRNRRFTRNAKPSRFSILFWKRHKNIHTSRKHSQI